MVDMALFSKAGCAEDTLLSMVTPVVIAGGGFSRICGSSRSI